MKKALALLLLLLLAAGCRKANTDIPAVPAAEASAAPTAEPSSAAPAETEAPAETDEPGQYAFSFTAKTLAGEEVTEACFGQYALTMVNVWASWCPPCKGELSELGVLYGRLPENVGFLSVTVDDPRDLPEAQALLADHGCAFPCLDGQGSEGLMNGFLNRVMAIPTTIFFDQTGNQVGEWIVGVPQGGGSVSDAYLKEIQARLDLLNGK